MKTEELINIANKIDDILHDHGYVVDHDSPPYSGLLKKVI